jgi:hypothetical protein
MDESIARGSCARSIGQPARWGDAIPGPAQQLGALHLLLVVPFAPFVVKFPHREALEQDWES